MTDTSPTNDAPIALLDPPAPPTSTGASAFSAASDGAAWPPGPRPSRVTRFFRGKESDPVWVRPAC
jgi:hypothetical protein